MSPFNLSEGTMNAKVFLTVKRTTWKALLLTLLISLLTYTVALAASGGLDNTFSGDGKLTTNIGGKLKNDYGRGVAIQSDGKIIVAGEHRDDAWTNEDFAVVRYKANGALDKTFSGDGKATANFGGIDQATGVVLQSDNKIVVAGQICDDQGICDVALARFNSNGSLDTTFSKDGKVTTDFGGDDNGSYGGVAIQSNGKIVVVGYMYNGSDYDMAIHRYNANGSLDKTFSGDGRAKVGFGAGRNDNAIGVAIQSDGKIVIAGDTCDASYENCKFAAARLNSNGTLDATFSGDGKQTTNLGGSDTGWAVALQSDGKIVVAGYKETASDSLFALVRYKSDGNLDNTFSKDGKATTNLAAGIPDQAYAMAIQSNGKIIAVGKTGADGSRNFALVRYKANGALDKTFSGSGKVITDFGGDDYARAVALQSNGRIVVAGSYYDGADWDFAVARYLP
jgi:uncharacterized delta-60 repeat protein